MVRPTILSDSIFNSVKVVNLWFSLSTLLLIKKNQKIVLSIQTNDGIIELQIINWTTLYIGLRFLNISHQH